ncbi:unnamed protein product [Amoebophrya sp. A120]|nr:unnamed protein product [Amoebophrya sp. A120]|eukprot:GSA120T00022536001.1
MSVLHDEMNPPAPTAAANDADGKKNKFSAQDKTSGNYGQQLHEDNFDSAKVVKRLNMRTTIVYVSKKPKYLGGVAYHLKEEDWDYNQHGVWTDFGHGVTSFPKKDKPDHTISVFDLLQAIEEACKKCEDSLEQVTQLHDQPALLQTDPEFSIEDMHCKSIVLVEINSITNFSRRKNGTCNAE